ncbi:serine hydrolase [Aeromicrobium phragmitis]|uniref:Serine hydrolase n=2 Tax=Aeromicrobium phragmitis TaxID=2478914 RepID=A0A3L8PQH4_9ACTN|nr:serine hydrolase [Aeromicrobium phragmitis]
MAAHQADVVVSAASIGKVFALVEAARAFESGDLDPGELLSRTVDDLVADSGLWQVLRQPVLSAEDACWLIGAASDNVATNVLVRRLGLDAVRAVTQTLGFTDSGLLDRVRDERGPEHPPALSVGTATELSDLMARLSRGEVVSAPVSRRVLGWLGVNTDLSMVGSAFGLDPLAHREADRGVRLANKTGTDAGIRGDIGVVSGPDRAIAYAVLAQWDPEGGDRRDDVLGAMGAVGRWISERLRPAG